MTTILAHIEVFSGQEERFESIMQDMVTHTLKEEGVLRYEYFKGQQENFYYCLLAFRDKWAFYEHQNSEHHESHDFTDLFKTIKLEYLDPVQDASPLPHTLDPPLPSDCSRAMAEAQKRYPILIGNWWSTRK